MGPTTKAIALEKSFPLHWNVWHNNLRSLYSILESKEHDVEMLDPRGRTPLHLAISMGHMECAKALLRHNADANKENLGYWTALHEATCTGDPELVSTVLQYRDYQRFLFRTDGIPSLLKKIREAPDFYVEMTWEFTSWLPFVSRMCPSDTYKVYKSGSNVRIDTTLLGFDNMKWQRGSRTYIFSSDDNTAKMFEIDHDARAVYCDVIKEITAPPSIDLLLPSSDQIASRLTSPVVTSYIKTESIEFERAKTGLWGFRTDKNENINGYECKVFNASNVQFITKTRTEHMSIQDKKAMKKAKTPLQNFLGLAEKHVEKTPLSAAEEIIDIHNPCSIQPEEYFDSDANLGERDIGRPREMATKVQKFKASLSLCEDYPLSLQEQVLPIIDLMAVSNAHFRKLKEFITLQLPAGFPVKIEIPLFHVLNAQITFGNIFSSDKPVDKVTAIKDTIQRETDDGATVMETIISSCCIDESVFVPPEGYRKIGDGSHHEERYVDEDDQLLQFALTQSMLDSNQTEPAEEQISLDEALNSYSTSSQDQSRVPANPDVLDYNSQLAMALELSKREFRPKVTTQSELERKEMEELERILALSLIEK